MGGRRLTPAQVAMRLSVTVKRIYELIRDEKLPAVDVSTGEERPRWRVEEEALEAFESARLRRRKK